jgi:hypothetical protein
MGHGVWDHSSNGTNLTNLMWPEKEVVGLAASTSNIDVAS